VRDNLKTHVEGCAEGIDDADELCALEAAHAVAAGNLRLLLLLRMTKEGVIA